MTSPSTSDAASATTRAMTLLRRGMHAALCTAALGAGAPTAAHAGEIYKEQLQGGGSAWVFEADAGVDDTLHLYQGPDQEGVERITFGLLYGQNSPARFPAECEKDAMEGVVCPAAGISAVVVTLGDGDDKVTGATEYPLKLPMLVAGGGGDDDLSGGGAQDALAGEAGNDKFEDSQEADAMFGGPGDDAFHSGPTRFAPGDVFDGGEGTDTATVGRAAASAWSLDDAANDGLAAENDNLRAIENLEGSSTAPLTLIGNAGPNVLSAGVFATGTVLKGLGGNDVLRGSGDDDTLEGGEGDDALEASQGDDVLDGGPGTDKFVADYQSGYYGFVAGNDTVLARDGVQEQIDCGLGADRAQVDGLDVTSGCEAVDKPQAEKIEEQKIVTPQAPPRLAVPAALRDRRAPYAFKLRGRAEGVPGCAGRKVTVQVRKGRRTVVRRTVKLGASCTFTASIRVRARGRYVATVKGAGLSARTKLRAG